MSARELPAVDAMAFRLAVLLEQYEQDVEELTSTWFDPALYARVSRELGEMRLLCAQLPLLSVQSIDLLISHAELVHCLWTGSPTGKRHARPNAARHATWSPFAPCARTACATSRGSGSH